FKLPSPPPLYTLSLHDALPISLVGDQAAAVDIAQEAFTRLLARWRKVRDARAWLFFVATNLSRDHWRSVTRDRELSDRAASHLQDRKSTRLNSSHLVISYAVFC